MIVKRSYLVRLIQEYRIDEEEAQGINYDSPQFDDLVCSHVVVREDYETIDNDDLEWTINGKPSWQAQDERPIREQLEYLRGQLRAERIAWGELAELQSLAEYIEPGDLELLEAAGVPEFSEDEEA